MSERTTCVVVGGGPAGMVLGLLLARAGVEVTVLEKHADFLRDFRGDTVHPSTLELLDELGLADRFVALPHSRVEEVAFPVGEDRSVVVADFRRLRVRHPYVAMVPQWDLLDLLAEAGREEPTFSLRMRTEMTGLIRESGRVQGVRYRTQDGRHRRDPRRPHRRLRRPGVDRPPPGRAARRRSSPCPSTSGGSGCRARPDDPPAALTPRGRSRAGSRW